MSFLYTLSDEQWSHDYPVSIFNPLGVFSSLENAQAAALTHLAQTGKSDCDKRTLRVHGSELGALGSAESIGTYNGKGEWLPKGQSPPVGFYYR